MYNKNRSRKVNSKKILHKVKKHWVVVSLALLSALGFGTTEVQGRADTNNDQTNHQDQTTTQSAEQPKAKLVRQDQTAQLSKTNGNSDNNKGSVQESSTARSDNLEDIQQRANALHQQILSNGIKAIGHHHASANVTANQNSNRKGQSTSNQPNQKGSDQSVTGQWGTAPFKFDSKTGILMTTGQGQIDSITNLSGPKLPLSQIKSIQFAPGTVAPADSSKLFAAGYDSIYTTDGPSDSIAYVSQLRNLQKIDLSNLNTDNVTNMDQMFLNDSDLQNINFGPHFNTNNVEAMAGMFESDLKLNSLDLSQFNTANVLDMDSMFQSDYDLSDLNLGSNFNTRYTVYMYNMFRSDNSLKHLDLSNNFNTDYVIDSPKLSNHGFSHMFTNDYNLSSLKLGNNFNTKSAVNFSDMFANDSDLPALNLGKQFDTFQATDMHNMFKGDSTLKYLNLGNHFDTTLANAQNYEGKSSDKNPYGIPNVTVQYHGADGVFTGDNELNTLVMNNTLLTPSVDLETPNQMKWYLTKNNVAQGSPFNLTNGQPYSGVYSLSTDDPVVTTTLNFVDDTNYNQTVSNIPVYGLKGDPISYGTIVNRIQNGYQLDIPVKDYIRTFPNMPFNYKSGTVTINIKPVQSQVKQDYANKASAASYASKGASEADSRIAKYYQNSVSNSVKTANHEKAELAAQSADRKIERSYQNSVRASVAAEDQSLANHAADSADQQIESSIAKSYVDSADQKIEQSYQNSVKASVTSKDQSLANSAASSADQSIENSIAESYANQADQSIKQSYQESASVREQSLANSIADSVMAQNQSTDPSDEDDSLNTEPSAQTSSLDSNSVASESQTSSTSDASSNRSSGSSVSSVSSASAIRQDNNDHNAPVNALKIGQDLRIGNRIVSRAPVKYRKIRINRTCLAHDHIISVGKAKDYSGNLKKGTVVKIEKTFRVKVNHHIFNRYEIILGHHHYFITANSLYAASASIQPGELHHHHVYGTKAHRYYHVIITKPCFVYKNGHHEKRLRRGSLIHVKGIIYTGRKGHRVEHLILTNGQLITANKDYVKIR